jgi:hypothetical protein
MDRTLKIYIGFLLLLLAGIVIIDINRPKPIDWTPTYDTKDKNPFGLAVFNDQLPELVQNQKINKINITPYEYLESTNDRGRLANDYKIKGTFLNISAFNNLDEVSTKALFNFVGHGNSVFLSMKFFPKILLDSLKLSYGGEYKYTDSIYNWVANPRLGSRKYHLIEGIGNNYFSKIDTLKTTVLGYQSGDSARVNFIKVSYKSGNFYLHTQPAAFTNFHLLKDNHYEYAEKVLSYIPKGDIYWHVKNQNGEIISNSPLRYILGHPALRWAWYLFLLGMAVFMAFNAKRRQRIVPVIKPLENTTVDFAKTIGNLYFQEGNHDNLIDKKIIYFLEKIRQDYLIETAVLDNNFVKKLQHKSGKDLQDIERLVFLINSHRKHHFMSIEQDLIEINNAIEKIIN